MTSENPTTNVSKGALWTGRVLSGLITVAMLLDGTMKIMKPGDFAKEAAKGGIPESTLSGIGIALIVSTVLYAIPQTAVLGAILLTGYFGGAVLAHVRLEDPIAKIAPAVIFGILTWVAIYLRDRRLRALAPIRSLS
jgi:hypothetical protein